MPPRNDWKTLATNNNKLKAAIDKIIQEIERNPENFSEYIESLPREEKKDSISNLPEKVRKLLCSKLDPRVSVTLFDCEQAKDRVDLGFKIQESHPASPLNSCIWRPKTAIRLALPSYKRKCQEMERLNFGANSRSALKDFRDGNTDGPGGIKLGGKREVRDSREILELDYDNSSEEDEKGNNNKDEEESSDSDGGDASDSNEEDSSDSDEEDSSEDGKKHNRRVRNSRKR
ncbi:hypothetical protein ACJQWK_02929 [Exserohilum turcicum]